MTPRTPRVVRVSPRVARAAIARALLGAQESMSIGEITLMPHQCDAVTRVHQALSALHVALLADDVGLGKTYVALAVASNYRAIRVIAPASLLPMWRTAISRTRCDNVTLESLQGYSRALARKTHPDIDVQARETERHNCLVIIDEAHHLRGVTTKRYRAISQLVSGTDLLLLSATPIHNSPKDLQALLALARGSSLREISAELLARVVVRRTVRTSRPRIVRHAPTPIPHNSALLESILELPAPLPAHDGAIAGALIRLGLLRAWCSSEAALRQTLTRRLLRGEALRQSLLAGRHPTNTELRSWLVGDNEVQLAFPELMVSNEVASGSLLETLGKHLDAVRALRSRQELHGGGDEARAQMLKTIAVAHADVPVVAFSQFAETVRAVGRALSDIAGVAVVTGTRAQIASGSVSRAQVLGSFAPSAQGRPPPPDNQRVRLLLATDLLAEGVNLQDAGVVVHLDLPWTDALRRQRVGRIARVGSPHRVVHSYQFEPPHGAETVLQMHARLRIKARFARKYVGAFGGSGARHRSAKDRRHPPSAAELASDVRAVFERWRGHVVEQASAADPIVAYQTAEASGFLAILDTRDGASLVGGMRAAHAHLGQNSPRYVVRTSPRHLLALARGAMSSRNTSSPNESGDGVRLRPSGAFQLRSHWLAAERAILRWQTRSEMRASLGRDDSALHEVHHRALAELARAMLRIPKARRVVVQSELVRAEEMVQRVKGAGGEMAMREWVAQSRIRPPEEWIRCWRAWPLLAAVLNAPSRITKANDAPRASDATERAGIAVLLLLVGDQATPD